MDYGIATANVYNDFSQLNDLKFEAKQDKNAALKKVAQQFESVFLGMMMKSMRQANSAFKSDLMNSDSTDFYQDMYDQQLSVSMGGKGFGIAEMVEKQLAGDVNHPKEDPLDAFNHIQAMATTNVKRRET